MPKQQGEASRLRPADNQNNGVAELLRGRNPLEIIKILEKTVFIVFLQKTIKQAHNCGKQVENLRNKTKQYNDIYIYIYIVVVACVDKTRRGSTVFANAVQSSSGQKTLEKTEQKAATQLRKQCLLFSHRKQ
jgi:hypothetical protein